MYDHLEPKRLFSLQGKVAFIIGAAGGIASGVTGAFAAAGAKLVLADRDEGVRARAAALRAAGYNAESTTFDVNDRAAAIVAIEEAGARSGRLDILVNNAAVTARKPFLSWRRRTGKK